MVASYTHFFLLFSLAFSSISFSYARLNPQQLNAVLFPIKKDTTTSQYFITFKIGTNPIHSLDLVIDLGGQFLWYDCDSTYNSSTYRPSPCDSKTCEAAKGIGCVGCNGSFKPGCSNNTCGISPFNPFGGHLFSGGLGEDVTHVTAHPSSTVIDIPQFLSACSDSNGFSSINILEGMAEGTKGMAGLGRTQIALPTQLSSAYKLANKFDLCLPSNYNGGHLVIGMEPSDLSKFLTKTPLIINPVSTAPVRIQGEASDEYFIDVKSIKVGEDALNLKPSLLDIDDKGNGGTKISTIDPYTVLHSSIFKPIVRDFVKKASDMKIKRVENVAPFGACFDSKTIGKIKTGPAVPSIAIVLQNQGVEWTIYGSNSMVKVKEDVLCLGFVDGGSKPRTSVVIGGHQLEDNLLEFDLSSSMLGFTSSLFLHNTSCSHF